MIVDKAIGQILGIERMKDHGDKTLARLMLMEFLNMKAPYHFDGFKVDCGDRYMIHACYWEMFTNNFYGVTKNLKTVIDGGANIGMFTLRVKRDNPQCNITCFEAAPSTLRYLTRNIQANNLENVNVYGVALSGDDKGICLPDNCCNGSNSIFSKGERVKVPSVALSKYIDGRIDLLKLDIEGSEYAVLDDLEVNDKFKFIQNLAIEFHMMGICDTYRYLCKLKRIGYEPILTCKGEYGNCTYTFAKK